MYCGLRPFDQGSVYGRLLVARRLLVIADRARRCSLIDCGGSIAGGQLPRMANVPAAVANSRRSSLWICASR